MNPLIQGKSGTTPVMSRNAFSTNQGTNEDDSQSDPHPDAGIFGNQTMRNSGQKDRRDTAQPNKRDQLLMNFHSTKLGSTKCFKKKEPKKIFVVLMICPFCFVHEVNVI